MTLEQLGIILTILSIEVALIIAIVQAVGSWLMLRGDAAKEQEYKVAGFVCIVFIILLIVLTIFLVALLVAARSVSAGSEIQPEIDFEDDGVKDVSIEETVNRRYVNSTYVGDINKETDSPNGKGTMRYDNGDVYEGNWMNGEREGYGKMNYSNGDVYVGDWKEGQRHGNGTYIWKEGGKYTGEYKYDMRDGEGIYTGWTGYIKTYGWSGTYTGTSKSDKFEGAGKFEFSNGDRFEGYFSENKLWDGTYIKSDGAKFLIENGVPIGNSEL